MFAFGDLVRLPSMYTLQGLYLVQNPVQLSSLYLSSVLLELIGFSIFVSINNHKDFFKTQGSKLIINGRPVATISYSFSTGDDNSRKSHLLISGWCDSVVIYIIPVILFYSWPTVQPVVVYLTILLLPRTIHDKAKYARNLSEI